VQKTVHDAVYNAADNPLIFSQKIKYLLGSLQLDAVIDSSDTVFNSSIMVNHTSRALLR
jgi:hypothetical protein